MKPFHVFTQQGNKRLPVDVAVTF